MGKKKSSQNEGKALFGRKEWQGDEKNWNVGDPTL